MIDLLRKIPIVGRVASFAYDWRNSLRQLNYLDRMNENVRELSRAVGTLDLGARRSGLQPSMRVGNRLCTAEDFDTEAYQYWCDRIQEQPKFRRKQWEFVFICESLRAGGLLAPGRRGLGFGVGNEPLPALFGSDGCEVVASDLDPEGAAAKGWVAGNQYAGNRERLFRPGLCNREDFDRLISYRHVDMSRIPADLRGFDFCWSACSLEHLGSLDKGFDFIMASVDCLKPGGTAVHTTEFNVFSDDATVASGETVLYRRQDLERLRERVAAAGHTIGTIDYDPGTRLLDRFIDVPPYGTEPHLKLLLMKFVTTSVGLVITKSSLP